LVAPPIPFFGQQFFLTLVGVITNHILRPTIQNPLVQQPWQQGKRIPHPGWCHHQPHTSARNLKSPGATAMAARKPELVMVSGEKERNFAVTSR
jgi:hypothetical protein